MPVPGLPGRIGSESFDGTGPAQAKVGAGSDSAARPGHPGRSSRPSQIISAMVEWQPPQAPPAPHARVTSRRVEAPSAMARRTCFSETPWQRQTTMTRSMEILKVNFKTRRRENRSRGAPRGPAAGPWPPGSRREEPPLARAPADDILITVERPSPGTPLDQWKSCEGGASARPAIGRISSTRR